MNEKIYQYERRRKERKGDDVLRERNRKAKSRTTLYNTFDAQLGLGGYVVYHQLNK